MIKNKKPYIFFIGGILLVFLSIYFFSNPDLSPKTGNLSLKPSSFKSDLGQIQDQIKTKPSDLQTYDDENFSFQYPKNFLLSSYPAVGGGTKIVVESSTGNKQGFQIAYWSFDESEPLTPERIKSDLPDLVMENIKNIKILNDLSALSFYSRDENIGHTFEIWFVYDQHLYQVMTYLEFSDQMQKILETIKFK